MFRERVSCLSVCSPRNIPPPLTCVKICHATTTIFTDWSGICRATRLIIPRPLPPAFPETRYSTTAAARHNATSKRETASTIPAALSEHLLQVKPGPEVYPSMQMEQSARTTRPSPQEEDFQGRWNWFMKHKRLHMKRNEEAGVARGHKVERQRGESCQNTWLTCTA